MNMIRINNFLARDKNIKGKKSNLILSANFEDFIN